MKDPKILSWIAARRLAVFSSMPVENSSMGPHSRFPGGQDGGRYVWLSLIVVAAAAISHLGWENARGQEAAKTAPAPAPATTPAAPAPAPATAAGASAPVAAPTPEGEAAKAQPAGSATAAAETTPPKPESMLMWAIRASGLIGLFLLCLSVYFTALVIRLFMEFRIGEAVPTSLVEKLEVAIKEKKFQEAYDACKDSDSFLARLVRTGIAALPNGKPEAKEQMQAMSDEVVSAMEMKISYLAIIGTLGPMIGLVGTIWGMILSFQEIATAAGAQPRPEKVAEGISTALFITLEGVSLAVPAIFFFAFFRNRIAQISLEANKVADRTINSLMAAAKTTKPS